MSRESIIESLPWVVLPLTGTITTAVGSANVVGVGTLFVAEVAANDILVWTDDAGIVKMGQVSSVTNNLLLVLHNPGVSIATAVTLESIAAANQSVPFFRGDNTLVNAPIVSAPFASSALHANGRSVISDNEGVLIKSVYIRLPYQYTMADTIYPVAFYYADALGVTGGAIASIGEGLGQFHMSMENIEVPVNAYVRPPLAITGGWQIVAQFSNSIANLGTAITPLDGTSRVSQIDGPDVLNGVLLPVYIGARIIHADTSLVA